MTRIKNNTRFLPMNRHNPFMLQNKEAVLLFRCLWKEERLLYFANILFLRFFFHIHAQQCEMKDAPMRIVVLYPYFPMMRQDNGAA